ncbi:MAG: 2Fe-2S iron-sulfur cluster-binding protein [Bacteroidetes bacterium]|nr:2Fe-2S iron-sulfur cluster-binding protein [Bacteroidota bacterium]
MNLTINNRTIQIEKAVTVLEAAEKNDIYIPKMCAHPELTPYGGCRLCIVEIDGRRGYPTACTTMAEEGMTVRTDTKILREMRENLLQLILSEHPSACLLCEDIDGCKEFQSTIRKVGITTGCRWCPKDRDCELQKIVESFNIHQLTLPGLYRDLPIEKYDPFFDRDYNLCIYCGRCVRICSEYRKSSVLALKQRGKQTTIGPAFTDNHTDAGCEYCGACVSVCPTGAMSEKSRKWWGVPESYVQSVCPLCSLNCEIQVLTAKNKIVGTLPPGLPHESAGDLCVKGRFCLSELVNRTERILEPIYLFPEGNGIVVWDQAIDKAELILSNIQTERTAVFLSPDLSTEEYEAVRLFSEKVLKTSEITSSCFDSNLIAFSRMAMKSASIETVKDAGVILSFFLNGNYNYGPLTLAIKTASDNGVPYYQTGWIKDTTSRFARHRFVPVPGEEVSILDEILKCLKDGKTNKPEILELSDYLIKAGKGIIVAGPEMMSLSNCQLLLEKIETLAIITKSQIFMPLPYGNLKGMLSVIQLKPFEDVLNKVEKGKFDLLYFIGDAPFSSRPEVKYILYQNSFPAPEGLNPDLVLPAALWGETGGTWAGSNGHSQPVVAAALPHNYALSHQEILIKLAEKMQNKEFVTDAKNLISGSLKAKKPMLPALKEVQKITVPSKPDPDFPYVLVEEISPHRYHNLNLSKGISGFGELVRTDQLMMNPSDARKLKIKDGDSVEVVNKKIIKTLPVTIRKNITEGFIHLNTSNGMRGFDCNPCYVDIRRVHV